MLLSGWRLVRRSCRRKLGRSLQPRRRIPYRSLPVTGTSLCTASRFCIEHFKTRSRPSRRRCCRALVRGRGLSQTSRCKALAVWDRPPPLCALVPQKPPRSDSGARRFLSIFLSEILKGVSSIAAWSIDSPIMSPPPPPEKKLHIIYNFSRFMLIISVIDLTTGV